MKKFLIIGIVMILALALLPLGASAQVQIDPNLKPPFAANITSPEGNTASVANIILQLIAGSLIYAAGPIAVLMLAVGGFRYVTSHGDQNQMEGAKKTIIWAIIGLLVIIVSFAIIVNIINIAGTTGT